MFKKHIDSMLEASLNDVINAKDKDIQAALKKIHKELPNSEDFNRYLDAVLRSLLVHLLQEQYTLEEEHQAFIECLSTCLDELKGKRNHYVGWFTNRTKL